MKEKADKQGVQSIFEDRAGRMLSGAGAGVKRAQMCYSIAIFMLLAVHFVYVILFQVYQNTFFMWYNVEIVLFYAWCLLLTTRRRYRLVVTLGHIEVISFCCVSVVLLGWDYSFAIFLLVLASVIYLNPFGNEHTIFAFSLLEAFIFLILWGYSLSNEPLMVISSDAECVFRYVNYCSSFIGIIAVAGMSKLAVYSLTTQSSQILYNQVTKAFSREYFYQSFQELLESGGSEKYTLVCMRVVDFPMYREFFGQEKADEVLRTFATYLKPDKDYLLFGHISSDTFGIVMETDKFSEQELNEEINRISELFSNERYKMRVAIGVYHIEDMAEKAAIHWERGRMALNEALSDVSRPVVYFDAGLLEKSKITSNIIAEFDQALQRGEFKMYLQPQMERDLTLHGAETLVRWEHPEKGLISPALFIPVLEEAGLIYRLDEYIWEEAAKLLKRWKEQGRERYSLSINISVRDFYFIDLYKHFHELVKKYDISPKSLKLEVTETILMTNAKDKLEILRKLREDGFIVEIDDFGSGYSSLNMLKEFPVDVLKVDMVFLRGTVAGDRGRKIIKSVNDLAKTLDMTTVVEGVETKEQLEDLIAMGCDVFQGMYFSKAIPVEEFEELYF